MWVSSGRLAGFHQGPVVQAFQAGQFLRRIVPDQGAPALAGMVRAGAVQGQEGAWSGRVEALPGNVFNRPLITYRDDHRLLFILVPGGANAGQLANSGLGAIGSDHQGCEQLAAIIKGDRRGITGLRQ